MPNISITVVHPSTVPCLSILYKKKVSHANSSTVAIHSWYTKYNKDRKRLDQLVESQKLTKDISDFLSLIYLKYK